MDNKYELPQTHSTNQYGNYLVQDMKQQNQAYFNKVVRCSKHGRQCTMVCMMDNCQDRMMCQECVTTHDHSHLHKIMPLQEFNDQTNAIPSLLAREINNMKIRVYEFQNTMIQQKNRRKLELQKFLGEVLEQFKKDLDYFQQESLLHIERHFDSYTQKVSAQIYTIQKHLDTLKPYVTKSGYEVQSQKIQNYLQYQEKMMKEVVPSLEIQVNNLSEEIFDVDIYLNKDSFQKTLTNHLFQNLKINKLFTIDNPNQNKKSFNQREKNKNRSHRYDSTMEDILEGHKLTKSQPNFENPFESHVNQDRLISKNTPFGHFHDSKPQQLLFTGHRDIVTFICLIDYNKFASASGDGTIKIWQYDQVYANSTLDGHTGDVWSLCMVSDRLLASCSSDKSIKIWDINELTCVTTLIQGHSDIIKCLCFMPTQRYLCSGGADTKIIVWDLKEKRVKRSLGRHDRMVKYLVYSDKFKMLASCSQDKKVKLWDMERYLCQFTLEGHQHEVNVVCFLQENVQNESQFYVASGDQSGQICIWSVMQGYMVKKFKSHLASINGMVINIRQNLLLTCSSDKTIKGFNLKSFILVYSQRKHQDIIGHMQYHDPRNFVVTAGWDNKIRAETLVLSQGDKEGKVMTTDQQEFVHNWAKHDYKYIASLD